jgi:osmotically-inducible protein OsmY
MRVLILVCLLAGLVGCSSMMIGGGSGSASSSTSSGSSSSNSDSSITAAVRGNLTADATVGSYGINVRTTGGRVTLSGDVDSYAAYEQAERLAIRTAGVKSIDNQIKVEISD